MQLIDKLMMVSMAVSNMPQAKEFYANKLGLKVATDYRQDDDNWWVSLTLPGGGATITLARSKENMPASVEGMKPGTMALYFATSDITAVHQELKEKSVMVNDIKDDLFGPGSGVKWFNLKDPDGNQVLIVQAEKPPWA